MKLAHARAGGFTLQRESVVQLIKIGTASCSYSHTHTDTLCDLLINSRRDPFINNRHCNLGLNWLLIQSGEHCMTHQINSESFIKCALNSYVRDLHDGRKWKWMEEEESAQGIWNANLLYVVFNAIRINETNGILRFYLNFIFKKKVTVCWLRKSVECVQ